MNVLYPYVHAGGKRMILFSNRRALLEQQRRQAQGTDATCMICQKLEYNFNHGREAIESGYEQEFWKINRTEYIPLMFDNSQHLVKPAYYKALSDCAFYRDILDKKASLVQ